MDQSRAEGPIVTLTMGLTFKLVKDVSKGEMVAICRELSEMYGDGNVIKPLGGKGLLQWAEWFRMTPGDGKVSGKEIRLLPHYTSKTGTIEWPVCLPVFLACFGWID